MQKEDSGCLVMAGKFCSGNSATNLLLFAIGWLPGSRTKTHFDWVRNFLNPKLSEEIRDKYWTRASSAFALFWNMTRSFGPPEVVKDFENFMEVLGIPAMDPALYRPGPAQEYTVPVNGTNIVFTNAHMAPPQGAFARNYGR